jgi:hypothetical protein
MTLPHKFTTHFGHTFGSQQIEKLDKQRKNRNKTEMKEETKNEK